MELAERLTLVGLATEAEFNCPLSQYVLADALGLTNLPVSRKNGRNRLPGEIARVANSPPLPSGQSRPPRQLMPATWGTGSQFTASVAFGSVIIM